MNQNAILRNEINQSGMRLYDISRKTRIYESKLKRFMQDGVDIPRVNLVQLGSVFHVFNQFAQPDPEPNKPGKKLNDKEARLKGIFDFLMEVYRAETKIKKWEIIARYKVAATSFVVLRKMGLISSDRDGGLWRSDRVPDYDMVSEVMKGNSGMNKVKADPIADMEKRVDMYYRVLQFLETDKISTRQRDVAKMFLCPIVIFDASKRLGLIVTKNKIRTWVGGTVTREMAQNVLNRSIRLAADNRENRNR